MLIRQIKTARAGTRPRPRERRHTALRWFGPKLRFDVESGSLVEKNEGEDEHPVEYQWDESGGHETHVDHAVCRDDEPKTLGFLRDGTTLGLLGGRDKPTGVSSPDSNSKEEAKIMRSRSTTSAKLMKVVIVAMTGLGGDTESKEGCLNSPTGDKHGEHSAKTTICTARSSQQTREKGNDAGRNHLDAYPYPPRGEVKRIR